jgi:glycerol uptake facilitator-like aquaporin
MRKLTSECMGTYFLALAIVGAGAMATTITEDGGLRLFINALVAAAILGLIISAFGPISGGHFNPAVTIVALAKKEMSIAEGVQYILAQLAGGIAGVITANFLFDLSLIASKTSGAPNARAILSEILSTAGLLFVIRHLVNEKSSHLIVVGVPLWIFAGYFFTPTSVIANPAMTVARGFTDSYAGIATGAIAPFVCAQIIGGLLGLALAQLLVKKKKKKVLKDKEKK